MLLVPVLLLVSPALLIAVRAEDDDYTLPHWVPRPSVQALHPRGFRVSMKDAEGVELVAFHGSFNRELHHPKAGEINVDVKRKTAGNWTYHNKEKRLRKGDVINYWMYVIIDGLGYHLDDQTFRVSELVNPETGSVSAPAGNTDGSVSSHSGAVPAPSTDATAQCELSATTVQGKPACKGQVVFEEQWRTLDLRRWEHDVMIAGRPDFEFCVYAQHPENSWVANGILHLKPTLTSEKFGEVFVRTGKLQLDNCTGGPPNSEACSRQAMFSYILPPVLAARLNSKRSFSFKYGVVEIRAKFPLGDWIYPELWLQSRDEEPSGRIVLAMARGNRNLKGRAEVEEDDVPQEFLRSSAQLDLSGRQLEAGALLGGKRILRRASQRGHWAEDFHNYTLLWTPDTLVFSVDGVELGMLKTRDVSASYDKEFYISLGIGAGGVDVFPDGSRSNNIEKPWRNTNAKAMINFWNAKNEWHPTWSDASQLHIKSVRVTALSN